MLSPYLRAELDAQKKLLDSLRPWPQAALRRLEEEFLAEWIQNSLALDGDTLSLSEVRGVIQEGQPAEGLPYVKAFTYKRALDYIRTLVEREMPFGAQIISQLHYLLLAGIDDQEAGRYRQSPALGREGFIPARPSRIRSEIRRLLLWLRREGRLLHPVERAALAHWHLIRIQPFRQANEPVARLFMAFLLLREGYPPAAILKAHERAYKEALHRAGQEEVGALVKLVGEAVKRGMELYLQRLAVESRL